MALSDCDAASSSNAAPGQVFTDPTTGTAYVMTPGGVAVPLGTVLADGDKGDIVVSGTGSVWTIDANAVGDTKLRDSAALSVIGRSANSTGDPADIAAANEGEVLRRSGTALGFGTVATAGIADDAVTYAKMQNISAASRLLGRGDSGSGDPQEITLGTGLAMSGTTLNASGAVSGAGSEVFISEQSISGVSSVTFSSIPSTYRDIRVILRARGTQVAANTQVNITVNGDTGANYDYMTLRGNGATASTNSAAAASAWALQLSAANAPAGVSGTVDLMISDYTGTTFQKDGWAANNMKNGTGIGNLFSQFTSVFWRSTAAITSITFTLASGNFATGSTATLYGRF